jgi:hypothetical protein
MIAPRLPFHYSFQRLRCESVFVTAGSLTGVAFWTDALGTLGHVCSG